VNDNGLTAQKTIMGTPEYIAPEQAIDAAQADIRADIYSLGCTLYFLLMGRPPFVEPTAMQTILAHLHAEASPLHELRSDVPADLSAVVARMIKKDPTQRYRTPREVADALAPFCKPSMAVPVSLGKELLTSGIRAAEETEDPLQAVSQKRSRWAAVLMFVAGLFGLRWIMRPSRWAVALTMVAALLGLGWLTGVIRLGHNERFLSDMEEFAVQVAEGPPGVPRFAKNGNLGLGEGDPRYDYGRINVNGKNSPHGLSMNPNAEAYASVKYRLEKRGQTFLASVALDDSAGGAGLPPGLGDIPTPLTFQVLGDGKILWQSKPVATSRTVQQCSVDVSGVEILELCVLCPGPGENAYAVWLEPRLLPK
jgi:NPCBM/NEW2 domain/Protein kinase domain